MNPGTTIIIIIGIVTFLLYLSKAFKPILKEKFQVLSDSEMTYRGPSKITEIAQNANDFNKLVSALRTPEFSEDTFTKQTVKNERPATIIPKKTPIPEIMKKVIPVTESNVGSALPANTPASILNTTPTPTPVPPPEPFVSNTSLSPDKTPQNNPPLVETKTPQNNAPLVETKTETKIVYVNTKCPPPPDMSQYIRKDSIPCWGCNLR